MDLNQFSSLNDSEIKNLKDRIIVEFEKIKNNVKKKHNSITLLDILDEYDGNKFDFNPLTSTPERVYYMFSEVGDNIWYHSIYFIDPIGKQKSFFAKIPIEYISQDTVINSIEIENNFYKIIEERFENKFQEYLPLGRIDTNGDNKKILIFDGQYEIAIQTLLGNRILPVRVFLNPDLNSLCTTCYQKW